MRKTLMLAALLLSSAAHAQVSGAVTFAYTPSGDNNGDGLTNRPCEFFQINNQSKWYAVPMTSLGSNMQTVKVENAAQEYLRNNESPNAVITFWIYGPVDNCSGALRADGISVGVFH